MKSRVTIDVDFDNQPVLKIEYVPSEDVRDKLVKKFLESFGGESRWAEFYFINDSQQLSKAVHGQANSIALVRPLSPHEMIGQRLNINRMVDAHEKMIAESTAIIEGSPDK